MGGINHDGGDQIHERKGTHRDVDHEVVVSPGLLLKEWGDDGVPLINWKSTTMQETALLK